MHFIETEGCTLLQSNGGIVINFGGKNPSPAQGRLVAFMGKMQKQIWGSLYA